MDVKTICLGVLTLREMTGYEIKKHFEEHFAHFYVAGFGSIYPALGKLMAQGLVTCRDVAQDKRPDKKVYRITERGRAALEATLVSTPPRHKVRSEFLVLVYFAHLLPAERLAAVLAERERDIEAMLEYIDDFQRSGDPTPGADMVAGLGRAALQAQLDFIRAHRDEWQGADERPRALERAV
ncbi:MAG: PadR family transcriptional regulator [Gammaproteobacteria bacterium]|nr:PadR family transcriptional regulator [Gammaproteobacteria bacterium]